MRIVLIGKTGQVGWELQRTLAPLGKIYAIGEDELDITNTILLTQTLRSIAPRVIVNAAAYTAVDRAEQEPEVAMLVNRTAPSVMAETALTLRAALIHISTDYVFDGAKGSAYVETDAPNPLSVYGCSKLEGEQVVQQVGGGYLVLRTSWVYSSRGNSFVNKVLAWSRKQDVLRVVADQVGSPTWARFLAEVIAVLIARGDSDPYQYFSQHSGIYHVAGKGQVSRYDWAQTILQLDPLRSQQVVQKLETAKTSEFPTPAIRPLYTGLDCQRFEKVFGLEIPAWDESLRLALENI
jgi:dTDP-4-dehydrorhamnose reductase